MRIVERACARERTTECPRVELDAERVACGGCEANGAGVAFISQPLSSVPAIVEVASSCRCFVLFTTQNSAGSNECVSSFKTGFF